VHIFGKWDENGSCISEDAELDLGKYYNGD